MRSFERGSSWCGLRGGTGIGFGGRAGDWSAGRALSAKGLHVGADFGLDGAEEFFGRETGEDAAGVEKDDAIGEIEGFVKIVGDEQDGLAELLE